MHWSVIAAAGSLLVGGALTLSLPAAAAPDDVVSLDDYVESDIDLQGSIRDIELRGGQDIDLRGPRDVAVESRDGAATVFTLASDVLFEFGSAELNPNATGKIDELLADAPQGASVKIHGHTDSVSDDAFNMTLSQQRAEAVAAAVRAARPDLVLDVQGFGETQPVASNGTPENDDPEGRAKNRRVEIRVGE